MDPFWRSIPSVASLFNAVSPIWKVDSTSELVALQVIFAWSPLLPFIVVLIIDSQFYCRTHPMQHQKSQILQTPLIWTSSVKLGRIHHRSSGMWSPEITSFSQFSNLATYWANWWIASMSNLLSLVTFCVWNQTSIQNNMLRKCRPIT